MQRIEYIQTDGNSYFVTPLDPRAISKLELNGVVFKLATQSGSWKTFVAAGTTSSPFIFNSGYVQGWDIRMCNREDTAYRRNVGTELTANQVTITDTEVVIDGKTYTFKDRGWYNFYESTGGHMTVFALENGSNKGLSGSRLSSMIGYGLRGEKIYEGYAYKDDNDTLCLYDIISGTKTYNSGTGTPVAGSDVPIYALCASDTTPYAGGTYTLTVGSGSAWTATVTKGSDFVTLSALSGSQGETQITMTVSANTLAKRDAEVVFSDGTNSFSFKFTQDTPLKYWRPLEYITTDGTQYVQTDFVPSFDSALEYKMRKQERVVSIDCCDGWLGQLWTEDRDTGVNNRNFSLRGTGSIACVFGNSGNKNVSVTDFNVNTDHIIEMDSTGVVVDSGTKQTWSPTKFENNRPMTFCGVYRNVSRLGAQRIYYATITENNTTVANFRAAQDVKGEACMADTVSGKMYYPQWLSGYSNPLSKGTLQHDFHADRYSMAFEPAGGEYEMTVTADSAWQCTTPTGYTIYPTSGSAGTTTVTVTAAPNATAEKIKGVATFYDADGYAFDLKLSTKTAGGHTEMYMGAIDAEDMRFGALEVSKICMGTVEVYGSGAFNGLKVKPTKTIITKNRLNGKIRIKASEPWTLTCNANWVTFSRNSGTAGTFDIDVTASQYQSGETATVTVTSANYTETTTVECIPYLIMETGGNCWFATGIVPQHGYKYEIENARFILDGGGRWKAYITNGTGTLRLSSSGSDSFRVDTRTTNKTGTSNATYDNKPVLLADKITFTESGLTYTLNGESTTISFSGDFTSTSASEPNVFIFSSADYGWDIHSAGGQIGAVTVYDGSDNVVKELIPMLDPSNNPVFFDSISGEYYYNLGTGTPSIVTPA